MEQDIKSIKQKVDLHGDQIHALRETVYGNKETGVKGMHDKVDEIHTILVQAKGLKGFANIILLFAAVVIAIKGWLLTK